MQHRTTVSADEGATLDENLQPKISLIRTDLDGFLTEEMRCLIAHGYAVARKACARLLTASADGIDFRVGQPPWNPRSFGVSSLNPEELAKMLKKSRVRHASLWNPRDPATWFLLLILLLPPAVFAASLLFNAAFFRNSYEKQAAYNVEILGQGERNTVSESLVPFRASSGQINVGCDSSQQALVRWPLPQGAILEGPATASWMNTDNIEAYTSSLPSVEGNLIAATGLVRGRPADQLPFGIRNCPGGGHGELVLSGVYRARTSVKTPMSYPLNGQLANSPLTFTLPALNDMLLEDLRITITSKQTGRASTINIPIDNGTRRRKISSPDEKFLAELNNTVLTISPK